VNRPASSAAPRRLEALDLLRLAAALLVVVYHYTFHGPGAYHLTWFSVPAAVPVTKYFYLGVPLFFVVSGFVIAYSAEGRPLQRFAIARFARIYPGFLFCMTLTFLVILLLGKPSLQVAWQQWFANLFVGAPLLRQPYVDSVYWSIVIEIVFYGWVAVAIALGVFDRRLPELVVAWLALSMTNELMLESGVLRRVLITNYSGFFAAGLMIYLLFRGRRTPFVWALLFTATAFAAIQENWNADWQRERGVELSPLVVVVGSVVAVLLVAGGVLVRRVPIPAAVLLALGGLTYPLYLIHQSLGYVVFNRFEGAGVPPMLLLGGTITAMIALSWLVYRFVELPARRSTATLLEDALGSVRSAAGALAGTGLVRPIPWAPRRRRSAGSGRR
jgi:peptidoglycan/LPS O-acetylase OafA/YrhL